MGYRPYQKTRSDFILQDTTKLANIVTELIILHEDLGVVLTIIEAVRNTMTPESVSGRQLLLEHILIARLKSGPSKVDSINYLMHDLSHAFPGEQAIFSDGYLSSRKNDQGYISRSSGTSASPVPLSSSSSDSFIQSPPPDLSMLPPPVYSKDQVMKMFENSGSESSMSGSVISPHHDSIKRTLSQEKNDFIRQAYRPFEKNYTPVIFEMGDDDEEAWSGETPIDTSLSSRRNPASMRSSSFDVVEEPKKPLRHNSSLGDILNTPPEKVSPSIYTTFPPNSTNHTSFNYPPPSNYPPKSQYHDTYNLPNSKYQAVPPTTNYYQPTSPVPPTSNYYQPTSPVPPTTNYYQPTSPVPPTSNYYRPTSPVPPTTNYYQPAPPVPPTANYRPVPPNYYQPAPPVPPTANYRPVPPTVNYEHVLPPTANYPQYQPASNYHTSSQFRPEVHSGYKRQAPEYQVHPEPPKPSYHSSKPNYGIYGENDFVPRNSTRRSSSTTSINVVPQANNQQANYTKDWGAYQASNMLMADAYHNTNNTWSGENARQYLRRRSQDSIRNKPLTSSGAAAVSRPSPENGWTCRCGHVTEDDFPQCVICHKDAPWVDISPPSFKMPNTDLPKNIETDSSLNSAPRPVTHNNTAAWECCYCMSRNVRSGNVCSECHQRN